MILLDEFIFAALCVLCYCYGCTVCSCVSGVFFFSSFLDKLPGGFCLVLGFHMPNNVIVGPFFRGFKAGVGLI